jgi:hypothetical protein
VADIQVEVNLRVPNTKTPVVKHEGYPIPNAAVRFFKRISVPSVPQPGATVTLATASGEPFPAEVLRTEWSEQKSMLVVYCKYGKRSITPEQMTALMSDPDWQMKPLL